jgi:hypothetical protein
MRRHATVVAVPVVLAALVLFPVQASAQVVPPPESYAPALSADGRWLAFISTSDDLIGGDATNDTNGVADAFLVDLESGIITLVSAPTTGGHANGPTTEVDVSADGRYVAFVSEATNLLSLDVNGVASDVFVLDTQTGALSLVSRRGSTGVQANAASRGVSISDDGARIAFTSYGTNLVSGDTNGQPDAFVRDRVASTTARVSTNSSGKQVTAATLKAVISGNGSVVAFHSTAKMVRQDTNGRRDVYAKTLSTGKTQLVSLTNGDNAANLDSNLADISRTGRYVVFTSIASNLVANDDNGVADTFVRDRTAATTTRVSRNGAIEANAASYDAAVSPDGAYVAFTTTATNLGGTHIDENGSAVDIFEFENATKVLRRVAVDTGGGWADGASFDPTYGPSSVIAFTSWATDLAVTDGEDLADVYTRTYGGDRSLPGTTAHRSVPTAAA